MVALDDGRRVGGAPVDAGLIAQHGDVDKATALALAAAEQVVGGLPTEFRRELGVFVSTGKPGMRLLERVHRDLLERGPACIPPDFIRRVVPSAPGDAVAERFGCGGVRVAPIGACSTGLDGAALAARAIRAGRIRGALVGSAEASLTPLMVAAFERMGVLATREPEPARAIRPYARDRAGFLIGEGAGVLLLESLASARARGAGILAELVGWAVVSDAHHQTDLAPDGAGVARAIGAALDAAGLGPGEIAHINAHGTATKLNDLVETRAIRAAFGAHADWIKICSTKPVTGHLLSASGSVELIVTIGAMRAGLAPPTLNLEAADPACDLDYTANVAVPCSIGHALVLNYGFGGRLGAAVLSQWTGR
jgi:3-oxoacyl-[acyl-carrier-protein] synthase II